MQGLGHLNYVCMMKRKWIKYITFLLAIGAFAACHNGKDKNAQEQGLLYKDPLLKKLSAQIKSDPANGALYYQRGMALHKMSQDTMALNDFRKAISLDSSRAEYYSAIGDLLFEHKDIAGSTKWLQKAISINPEDPVAHLKIAKMFLFTKDYPKAFAEINTVLRQDIYNPEAYFLKGMIYKDLKDTSKAISSFQTVINVSPQYKDAYIQLGILYSAKRDPVALQYYDNAFRLDTLDVSPLYDRGMYYQDQGDYEHAKQEYKNCILHNSQYADAYFNMGWILMHQDSLEKAWRQYDIVTQTDPTNTGAYYNRGLCSEMMGKKDDAIRDYKQALDFNPKYTDAKEALKRLGSK